MIRDLSAINFTASGIYANTMRFVDGDGVQVQICAPEYARNQTWDNEGEMYPAEFEALQAMRRDHVTIWVKDLEKSSAMYQRHFELDLRREIKGDTHCLGVGNGSFFGIQLSGKDYGYIDHYCLGLKDFDTDKIERNGNGSSVSKLCQYCSIH